MSHHDNNCHNNIPKERVSVELKKIVDKIDLPISIRFATLPGEEKETMFVATQTGEVLTVTDGKSKVFLDIKNQVLVSGVKKTPYDERGLLGLAFSPDFKNNGKFYLYYSQKDSQYCHPSHERVDPCDSYSLKQTWDVGCGYDHIDVLEEWEYQGKNEKCKKTCALLSIYQPFFNNNGRDNLVFNASGKLLLGIGDGGSNLDPFNLAQNNDSVMGKLLEIDLDKLKEFKDVYPFAYFSELPKKVRKSIKVLAKGIHNTSHPASGKGVNYLPNTGEASSEAVYAYTDQVEQLNLGWRPWEGVLPTTKEDLCDKAGESPRQVIVWDYDGFPKTGEGLTIKIREGDTLGFFSHDDMTHAVALCDPNWKLAKRCKSKYYIEPSKHMSGNIKFSEVGEYYLIDPYCERRLKLRVKVRSNPHRKDQCYTQDCIVFVKESLYLQDRRLPLVNLHHKSTSRSVNEITGGEYYKGSEISELTDSYVFCDLSQRCNPEGSLFYVRAGENLEKLQTPDKISVDHSFEKDKNLYVSLGTNSKQDKLYLGVYHSLGVKDSKLGGVYEIVKSEPYYDSESSSFSCSRDLKLSDTSCGLSGGRSCDRSCFSACSYPSCSKSCVYTCSYKSSSSYDVPSSNTSSLMVSDTSSCSCTGSTKSILSDTSSTSCSSGQSDHSGSSQSDSSSFSSSQSDSSRLYSSVCDKLSKGKSSQSGLSHSSFSLSDLNHSSFSISSSELFGSSKSDSSRLYSSVCDTLSKGKSDLSSLSHSSSLSSDEYNISDTEEPVKVNNIQPDPIQTNTSELSEQSDTSDSTTYVTVSSFTLSDQKSVESIDSSGYTSSDNTDTSSSCSYTFKAKNSKDPSDNKSSGLTSSSDSSYGFDSSSFSSMFSKTSLLSGVEDDLN
jgi:hypothetical protein